MNTFTVVLGFKMACKDVLFDWVEYYIEQIQEILSYEWIIILKLGLMA